MVSNPCSVLSNHFYNRPKLMVSFGYHSLLKLAGEVAYDMVSWLNWYRLQSTKHGFIEHTLIPDSSQSFTQHNLIRPKTVHPQLVLMPRIRNILRRTTPVTLLAWSRTSLPLGWAYTPQLTRATLRATRKRPRSRQNHVPRDMPSRGLSGVSWSLAQLYWLLCQLQKHQVTR